MRMVNLTLEQWVAYGIQEGYCTDIVCDTHNGTEMTPEEEYEFEEGFDPCIPVVRIWFDDDKKGTG